MNGIFMDGLNGLQVKLNRDLTDLKSNRTDDLKPSSQTGSAPSVQFGPVRLSLYLTTLTLCARVKTAIFENFSNMLPPISNVAKTSKIATWKKKLAVSNCFRKLFEKIEDDENDTYMTKIIKNVWPKKKNIPNLQIA
ncbi:hypothetical protein Glove_65g89 [Diversispora epigaea]|uniref:Uncharacterized protein n=1 Tax=Diversispora epigaea TaxID=1348612 RepID=A0A397JAT4_9GLOM|nr:hypothetical protein Glove_65g89 [Diversispora epigaea]